MVINEMIMKTNEERDRSMNSNESEIKLMKMKRRYVKIWIMTKTNGVMREKWEIINEANERKWRMKNNMKR